MCSLQDITTLLTYLGFADNQDYVYKYASGCIVVMKYTTNTITNEERKSVVDPNHAKFRASELEVIFIVNLTNTNIRPTNLHHYAIYSNNKSLHDCHIKYIVGSIVKPVVFDKDIEIVCAGGIHYFKTIETAYFYGCLHAIGFYDGIKKSWHDNGKLYEECVYVNGKLSFPEIISQTSYTEPSTSDDES